MARWIVESMRDPRVYPHPVDRVVLIETHISWVFLAGERAYKIKKPVNLGFLDFSTLRRRRHFCGEEVRLNRRLARDTYLGVVELKGAPPRLVFGGPGPTRETAVVMRRLPADRMLDALVTEGRADAPRLRAIARTVARFHAEAATGGVIDDAGRLETIRRNWEESFDQTAEVPPELWPPAERRALRGYVETFLEREAARLAKRVDEGRIRDGHGDLHAQHVCCTDPIQIFDCIEFGARYRCGDIAGEIAFLAMDLDRRGAPELGIEFLNEYLAETGDYGAVPLLDFYRAYRALVRAKVTALQVADRPPLAADARALFALAGRYARPRGPARLLLTSGVIGSGKSTLARALAARLGAIVIRTDTVRKRLAGLPVREPVRERFGEGLYRAEMSDRTYGEALRWAAEAVSAGWPVVIDGAFSRASERENARAVARRLGVPHATLWCDAPDPVIAGRLRERAAAGTDGSDGRVELLAEHRARYEPPGDEPSVVRVDADAASAVEPLVGVLPGS